MCAVPPSSTDKTAYSAVKVLGNTQHVYLMLITTFCRGRKGAIFYLMDDKGGTHHNGEQQLDSINESNTNSIIQNVC